jgi:hypothetical protein
MFHIAKAAFSRTSAYPDAGRLSTIAGRPTDPSWGTPRRRRRRRPTAPGRRRRPLGNIVLGRTRPPGPDTPVILGVLPHGHRRDCPEPVTPPVQGELARHSPSISIAQPSPVPEGDGRHLEEAQVVDRLLLVAHQQPAALGASGQRAFHDPPALAVLRRVGRAPVGPSHGDACTVWARQAPCGSHRGGREHRQGRIRCLIRCLIRWGAVARAAWDRARPLRGDRLPRRRPGGLDRSAMGPLSRQAPGR